MRILFVNFNIGSTAGINNGLAILSAALKEKGHKVGLIFVCEELGYNFDLERMKQDVLKYDADVIGISLMEPQFKYMEAFCDDLSNYYAGFIVCGGPYPTMDPENVLSIEGVDAVCIGEGEDAVIDLVDALEKGKDYRDIKNLWFKLEDGTIIKNRLRPFKDLNELPPEDKELFDLEKILTLKNYQLEMSLGRGCIYHCSYCINQPYLDKYMDLCERPVSAKEYVRMKNIDTAIKEIKNSISKHPKIRKIAFIDDNFIMYDSFLEEFLKRYKEEIGLPFMCNATPASFNISKVKLLKEAGCDDVRFGVESGSERIKKDIMDRPVSNNSVINAFRINREVGLMTSSFNMIGLPTETKEEVLETLKLNAILMPDTVKAMTFYPFKNTPIYDLCVKLNLIDYDKKWQLDNYDTFTCLKFPAEHQLFLKKIQTAFNWYINAFLNNGASLEYRKLIDDVEKMTEDEWDKYDFYAVDEEISQKLKKRGTPHYSKFVNRSLAVKYPSKHLVQNEYVIH